MVGTLAILPTTLEWAMKKIAIALTAIAGIVFLSGCAYPSYGPYGYYNGYPYRYAYGYGPYPYRYAYGYGPNTYWWNGARYNCAYNYSAVLCG